MEYILPFPVMATLALFAPVGTTATAVLLTNRLSRYKREDRLAKVNKTQLA